MTRDEALEALLLVQYVALIICALLLARLAHVGAAHLLRSLKPPRVQPRKSLRPSVPQCRRYNLSWNVPAPGSKGTR